MKKIISFITATVATFGTVTMAYATTPYQYNFNVTPDLGSAYNQTVDAPSDNDFCYLFGIDPSTHTPRLIKPNSGLVCDGNVFNVDQVDMTHVNGLSDVLAELRNDYVSTTATSSSQASSIANIIATMGAFISASTTQANWTQASTTLSDFIKNKPSLATVATSGSYTDLTSKPALGISYEGTTQRTNSFPIFKSATVGSGVAVFNLTADGTAGGTSICPNGVIQDSVNAFVSDAAASYQMAYAFSNSNKTVTVTTNKLTTANILTGILGQASGNGSAVKLSVWCY